MARNNKNTLNESQVRKFMKLANLQPLAQGFVEGLSTDSDLAERRRARSGSGKESSHGRGQGEQSDGSMDEGHGVYRDEDAEAQGHDFEDAEADLEHADDLEVDAAEDLEDIGDEVVAAPREVSVDDFLAALEQALESVMGDEVEISQEEEEVALDEPEGEEVELDIEDEEIELQEDQGADDREDEHLGEKDGPERGKKQSEKDRRKEMRGERRAKGEKGDPVPTQEAVNVDALVNRITARVAQRLVSEGLK